MGTPSASGAKSYDLQIKLMMIGDQAVGKTALLVRYSDDDFNEVLLPTIGIDFKIKVAHAHVSDVVVRQAVELLRGNPAVDIVVHTDGRQSTSAGHIGPELRSAMAMTSAMAASK